ncbi:MAG: dephospho-CoA kinase [Bacteroidota bacterium]
MLKIGLTGGIGSGKTTVAHIFKVLGIPVFDADTVAKDLMENNTELRDKLIAQFGTNVFESGKLNRKWLASIVFQDPHQLDLLNAQVHPMTLQAAENWFVQQDADYVIKEAALLFEAGAGAGLDFIIGVFAPPHIRIQRVMQRDGLSREEVLARIDRQVSDTIKMKLCDFVIVNDDQQLLTEQVLELHQKLIQLNIHNG